MKATETGLHINMDELRKAQMLIRAINHPFRQKIMHLVHSNGKMIVTDIYVKMRVEQPVASQHLAILRRAGIMTSQRDAKYIYYSVNYKRLEEIQQSCKSLIG